MTANERPKAPAAFDAFDVTTTFTSISDILSDLFNETVAAYYLAIDAERWDVVWRLADLIDAVHRCSEWEAA